MFTRLFSSVLLTLVLVVTPVVAQSPPAVPQAPPAAPQGPPGAAQSSEPNSVAGLSLPPDQTINYDEGFLKIDAKTKGTVKWLIVSNQKVKYVTVPPSSIILSIPPQSGQVISVFAVGLVDNQLTDFVRTNITVTVAPSSPGPSPPGATPTPPVGRLHFTFLLDLNKATPEQAQLLNSPALRTAVANKNGFFRIYDLKSPIVAQKKLDVQLQRAGGQHALIVQNDQGLVLVVQPIPRTEPEIMAILNKLTGGPG